MIELQGPRGLGDALLVRLVAAEWIRRGEQVRVHTTWPDLFRGLKVHLAGVEHLVRDGQTDLYACTGCPNCRRPEMATLSLFTRACHQCGLYDPVPFDLAWTVTDAEPFGKIKRRADGRPILIYQPPKIANGAEQELYTPPTEAFLRWLDEHSDHYRIKVGHPSAAEEFRGAPCELDLFGKTTVLQMIDLATIGDLFFSQVCFIPTLAETLGKRSAVMFTRRQLSAGSNNLHRRELHEVVYVD